MKKSYCINYDGRSFFVRIPKKIAYQLHITRKDMVIFSVVGRCKIPKGKKTILCKLAVK
jgi:antitoxin component of MazEF toxin-antitoxin module